MNIKRRLLNGLLMSCGLVIGIGTPQAIDTYWDARDIELQQEAIGRLPTAPDVDAILLTPRRYTAEDFGLPITERPTIYVYPLGPTQEYIAFPQSKAGEYDTVCAGDVCVPFMDAWRAVRKEAAVHKIGITIPVRAELKWCWCEFEGAFTCVGTEEGGGDE